MKKTVLTLMTLVLCALSANSAETICGANVESEKGSGIFNKSLFWEKVETVQPRIRFLLPDGSLQKGEEQGSNFIENIPNDSIVMVYNFQNNQSVVFIGVVKKDITSKNLNYVDTSLASAFEGKNVMLMAKGISLSCISK
jgi:hypothetical protein